MADFESFMRAALIAQAEAFAAHNGYSLGYVSRLALLDARFIEKLKSGKGSFTVRKFDEAMAYFEKAWPAGRSRPPVPKFSLQLGTPNRSKRNGKKGSSKKGRRSQAR